MKRDKATMEIESMHGDQSPGCIEVIPEPGRPFPASLVLAPLSRWPTTLPEATVRAVLTAPVPEVSHLTQPTPQRSERGVRDPGQAKLASIVIVSFNNLVYNRLCLESLLYNTEYPNYEVVVIDNGSGDGTVDYLRALERHQHIRLELQEVNRGFAAATNRGLALAHGEYLVVLNNDTLVPRGWLGRLLKHLEDPAIGLVGPATNRSGNEAQIDVPYRTFGEFERFAGDQVRAHAGETFDIRTATMFCTGLRRVVYQEVGPLDERFEIGLFEDDDYAMRVRAAGYRVVCADDVFVHHFGQATLGHLAVTGEYGRLFHANRRRWEARWGVAWEPYPSRPDQGYEDLANRVREIVAANVPAGATVLVASRGDEAFVRLQGRRGWHFPQTEAGIYRGYHPADSAEAIGHLEALVARGGSFFLIPRPNLWWLKHYREFKDYLERRHRLVVLEEETCLIYDLRQGAER